MLFIEKLPTRYDAGLASVTAGQKTVTPTNAAWLGNAWGDDLLFLPSQPLVPPQRIEAVNDDGTLTLAVEWPGTTETEVPYEIRYVGIIERSTAQTRAVLEQLGDVKAYYDVQVDTLADRADFDSRPAGYRVLVSDIGDGRAAIYSKASSADGDWTAAAMFSGPVGPIAEVTVSGTTTLAPGSAAEVTPTPTPEGVSLAFGIPAGRGAIPRGTYNPATEYVLDDAVLDNGSSWIALQATTGNAPPVLPATSNAWWQLLARAGQDGTGTGDVQGPEGAVDGRIAVFDGTSGKQLKQASVAISDLQTALDRPSTAEAQGGTATTMRGWAAEDVATAILALSPPSDTADLEFTVSQIALELADATNQAQFLGPTGNRFADSFDALTYVDVAGATDLDSATAGVLKPTAAIVVETPFPADGAVLDFANFTYINRASPIPAGRIIEKLGVYSTAAKTLTLKVSHEVTSGTQEILVSQAIVHPGGGWADVALPSPFLVPAGTVYLGAHFAGSTTSSTSVPATAFIGGNAGLGTSSGWTNQAGAGYALRYAYRAGSNNLTVRSAAFTAATIPGKMKALLQVKEVDAATAGTDYTLECSRDDGVTWTAMALTERYSQPSGLRVVEAAETDVSGQPSGTAPRWRFKTLNNKNVELHDVYFYWS